MYSIFPQLKKKDNKNDSEEEERKYIIIINGNKRFIDVPKPNPSLNEKRHPLIHLHHQLITVTS